MRCLIIKTSSLGDIVHAYPVVNYLKRCLPEVHLDWVVEERYAELVAAHPLIDTCYCVETGGWRRRPFSPETWRSIGALRRRLRRAPYDLVIDLQGNIKSALIASQVKCQKKVGFAKGYVAEWPNCWAMHRHILPPSGGNIRDDYLYLAQAAIHGPPVDDEDFHPVSLATDMVESLSLSSLIVGERPAVLFFGGSAWPNKRWNSADAAAFLVRGEHELGVRWLLGWGNDSERSTAEELANKLSYSRLLPRLPLVQLHYVMSLVRAVVSMDSLPLHLAAAAGTATFSLFGPSSANKYAPGGRRHAHLQGSCPYGLAFTKRCPRLRSCPTGACLQNLTSEAVFSHFAAFLSELKPNLRPTS